MRKNYNCLKCPGYCCSYPAVVVSKRDLERLAKYFGMTPEAVEKKYIKSGHGYKRIMRRKKDKHFGRICQFFDIEARRCGIYKARPTVCREYPGVANCGYYDFLRFERDAQNDKGYISTTYHPD
jgi:Fe-S-cluster containining protein